MVLLILPSPVRQTKRIVEVCMKHFKQALLISAIAVFAVPVFADCPKSLKAEQMIDCIVTEDAGYFYVALAKTTAVEQTAIEAATTQQEPLNEAGKDMSGVKTEQAY